MDERRNYDSVAGWLRANYPGYGTCLAPRGQEVAEQMARDYEHLCVPKPGIAYARNGQWPLPMLVAQQLASDIGALQQDYSARLTASGMNSIWAVFQALGIGLYDTVVAGQVLYGLTPEMFGYLHDYVGARLTYVDTRKPEEIVQALQRADSLQQRVVYLETIGNGVPMPVVDLRKIFRILWDQRITIVVDGTFTTTCLLNPWQILGELKSEIGQDPRFRLVYVESLSKYYRCRSEQAPEPGGTAGLVIAPEKWVVDRLDPILAHGHAIQWPALKDYPFRLFHVLERDMPRFCETAQAAVELLREHRAVKEVWYPEKFEQGAGGVVYFRLWKRQPGVAHKVFPQHMILDRGSFGHDESTIIDFSRYRKEGQEGLVRLAVGLESWSLLHDRLKKALDQIHELGG